MVAFAGNGERTTGCSTTPEAILTFAKRKLEDTVAYLSNLRRAARNCTAEGVLHVRVVSLEEVTGERSVLLAPPLPQTVNMQRGEAIVESIEPKRVIFRPPVHGLSAGEAASRMGSAFTWKLATRAGCGSSMEAREVESVTPTATLLSAMSRLLSCGGREHRTELDLAGAAGEVKTPPIPLLLNTHTASRGTGR